ncbi:membrane protein [Paraoerskovia sediminicola]|uniref:Membrane protein n=1 Tax=Paraoerskovia sediminicola TaxID=1138587 RepID=A0ABN6XCB3_9CELL|nr:lysylphosphatidylglycerol synthase transmembrane domain-containing protein [Paraoerskovia sediminicola]BDZ42514.1 membrane protein [Paraoerskovia sediminicola]
MARTRTLDDAIRLAIYLAVTAVGFALVTVADSTIAGAEQDVLDAMSAIPAAVGRVLVAVPQILVLVLLLGAPVALAILRRWRTLALGAAALVLAALTLILLEATLDVRVVKSTATAPAFALDAGWPSTSAIASFVAVVVVVSPELSRRWVSALWALVGVLSVLRVSSGHELPLDIVLAFGVGGVVGYGLLLATGRTVLALSAVGVESALRDGGLPVTSVEDREVEPWAYRVALEGGDTVVAKVVGRRDWQADRLYRSYRRVRLRGVGDDAPYSSPRRAAAVEALLSYHAAQHGVRTPEVRAVTAVDDEEVVLAVEEVAGRRLASLDPTELDDRLLDAVWAQEAALLDARIAHRALNLENLLVDPDGAVWLLDLGFGQPAAVRGVLAGDVAELLAATSAAVGPERAVAAAHGRVGPEMLADALPRLVPVALTRSTRSAVKAAPGGLDALVEELSRVTGVEKPKFVDVERLKPRYLLTGALLAVAMYVLAPQLANWPPMVDAIREADWTWAAIALGASILTYVGSGLGLSGGSPGRVPAVQAGVVALASSFVATVAPPGIGQVGLNIRFLQRRGLPTPVAVSASAVKEAAVLTVHLTLLAGFAIWVGRSGLLADEMDKLPSGAVLLSIAGGVVGLVALAVAIPRVRRMIREQVVPAVVSSAGAMREVFRSPAKVVQLFLGCALLPLGYAVCLFASVEALGGGVSFGAVALVSLTAGTIATAAPTPGGVGAVEAVLLASLTGIGLASAPALAAVFLYRIVTFWLPIAPGAVAFRWLVARKVL